MKNFVRRIRNIGNSGSTLIAVLVVTAILSLFLFTLQPIMGNYVTNSVKEMDLKQAEFSARSANDAIVEAIVSKNTALVDVMESLPVNGELSLNNFKFDPNKEMGSIDAKILRISDLELSVITKATVISPALVTISNREDPDNVYEGGTRTIARSITTNSVNTGIEALSSFYFYDATFTGNRGFNVFGDIPVVVENTFNIDGQNTERENIYIDGDLLLLSSNNTTPIVRRRGTVNVQGNLYTDSKNFRVQQNGILIIDNDRYQSSNAIDITSPPIIQITTELINQHNKTPSWVSVTGDSYTSGNLSGGNAYIMSGTRTLNLANLLNADVTPENPAYIILPNNARLTLSALLPGDDLRNPKVIFILQGNAQLTLQHQSSAIVHGTINTRLTINRPGGGVSDFYGQVKVGRIVSSSNNQINLHYRAISSGSGSGTVEWTPGLYTKATY